MTSPGGAGTETYRLGCELPTVVVVGGRRWKLGISYADKGRRAALVAECGDRVGEFYSGRTRNVYAALVHGISVPCGTMRWRIMRALVESGRAVLVPEPEDV